MLSQMGNNGGVLADSFYSIVETDINNKEFLFEMLKGKVVYLVNVASHCGYTQENYQQLRDLGKFRGESFELVIAPSNQFGAQEPGDAVAISNFAKSQKFAGVVLEKSDVNGPSTRSSFLFLKSATQTPSISWNFDGKFLIDKQGKVEKVSHLNTDQIERKIKTLLLEKYDL